MKPEHRTKATTLAVSFFGYEFSVPVHFLASPMQRAAAGRQQSPLLGRPGTRKYHQRRALLPASGGFRR